MNGGVTGCSDRLCRFPDAKMGAYLPPGCDNSCEMLQPGREGVIGGVWRICDG